VPVLQVVLDIDAVDQHPPLPRGQQPEQHIGQGALTRTGRADQSHCLAAFDFQGDVLQSPVGGILVAERQLLDSDFLLQRQQPSRAAARFFRFRQRFQVPQVPADGADRDEVVAQSGKIQHAISNTAFQAEQRHGEQRQRRCDAHKILLLQLHRQQHRPDHHRDGDEFQIRPQDFLIDRQPALSGVDFFQGPVDAGDEVMLAAQDFDFLDAADALGDALHGQFAVAVLFFPLLFVLLPVQEHKAPSEDSQGQQGQHGDQRQMAEQHQDDSQHHNQRPQQVDRAVHDLVGDPVGLNHHRIQQFLGVALQEKTVGRLHVSGENPGAEVHAAVLDDAFLYYITEIQIYSAQGKDAQKSQSAPRQNLLRLADAKLLECRQGSLQHRAGGGHVVDFGQQGHKERHHCQGDQFHRGAESQDHDQQGKTQQILIAEQIADISEESAHGSERGEKRYAGQHFPGGAEGSVAGRKKAQKRAEVNILPQNGSALD